MTDMSISAEDIKAGRERRHLTQADLAKEMGVSLRTIGSWERGESIPRNRVGALIEALSLEDVPQGYQWGTDELRARIGALAKQRREELGLSRDAMAERAELRSKQTVQNFEFARSMPRGQTLRQIEKVLEWKNNSIDEALESGKRAGDLTMEDFDQFDRTPQERPLASFSTEEVLAEAIRRLTEFRGALGPSKPVEHQFLYGLAANNDPSHLERLEEERKRAEEGEE